MATDSSVAAVSDSAAATVADDTHAGERLTAPHQVAYDYTRSTGPVLGAFFTALRQRQILGIRAADGRVLVPPQPYDPDTGEQLDELVEVADTGDVTTWTWQAEALNDQPLDGAFAWALILLDGADTPMLHAVEVGGDSDAMTTGMRVRARWADDPAGGIHDLACFVPDDTGGESER